MDDEDIEFTIVPPGKPARTYASVVPPGCLCSWLHEGVGADDITLLPEGAVATWYELAIPHPGCPHHGRLERYG